MSETSGKIYLVPTPIGNLGDITARSIAVLQDVTIIACEDTRHSGQLLKKLNIQKKLVSYHDFNEAARSQQLIEAVKRGESIAVITDAGSPGISDPAYRIVRAAIDNNLVVIPLPGPSALVPALTASGLPADRFFFEGFLPHKSAARINRLTKLSGLEHTIIFYESPHRIEKSLGDILEVFGDRQVCLAREISKLHEEFIRGKLTEVLARIRGRTVKGELVVVIAGKEK